MHSKDPAKSVAEFEVEFEQILAEAERARTSANFKLFVFPMSHYGSRTFTPVCSFLWAVFVEAVDFSHATFAQDVDFLEATFTREAEFGSANFTQTADFRGARFTLRAGFRHAIFAKEARFMSAKFFRDADFSDATITWAANFGGTTFTQEATFWSATFIQDAHFDQAKFAQAAYFVSSTFTGFATFVDSIFTRSANFRDSTFTEATDFGSASFGQDADFKGATFTKDVDFSRATFNQDVGFDDTTFSQRVRFALAILLGTTRFHETRFRHDSSGKPGLDFSDVKIEHPERVEFYKVDLRQALFHNTDVSKIDFTLVKWRDRGQTGWLRHLGRRYWGARFYLFDEDVNLTEALDEHVSWTAVPALEPPADSSDKRNYSLIAETYQQLKRNYDAKGDYWTAGHLHYGEMEMKRLHSRWQWRPLRWISHHFSLVALYKYASEYGESYLLPLFWLAGVLTLFAILYPIAGLELNKDSGGGVVGYRNLAEFFRTHPAEHPSGWPGLILHGFMTSISVAGFQRELKYAPSYPWGRLIALFELLLTTTLAALLRSRFDGNSSGRRGHQSISLLRLRTAQQAYTQSLQTKRLTRSGF